MTDLRGKASFSWEMETKEKLTRNSTDIRRSAKFQQVFNGNFMGNKFQRPRIEVQRWVTTGKRVENEDYVCLV